MPSSTKRLRISILRPPLHMPALDLLASSDSLQSQGSTRVPQGCLAPSRRLSSHKARATPVSHWTLAAPIDQFSFLCPALVLYQLALPTSRPRRCHLCRAESSACSLLICALSCLCERRHQGGPRKGDGRGSGLCFREASRGREWSREPRACSRAMHAPTSLPADTHKKKASTQS